MKKKKLLFASLLCLTFLFSHKHMFGQSTATCGSYTVTTTSPETVIVTGGAFQKVTLIKNQPFSETVLCNGSGCPGAGNVITNVPAGSYDRVRVFNSSWSPCEDGTPITIDPAGGCTDADQDSYCTPADCDDTNANINPGATEICNGIDDDCDGQIDEGLTQNTYYADDDGDGYGDPNDSVQDCAQPTGYVANASDCDDTNASVNPGATEICNSIDDDCDGQVDEGVSQTLYYADVDQDGFGDPNTSTLTCNPPSGYVTDGTDCDDTDATIYIGASCNDGDPATNNDVYNSSCICEGTPGGGSNFWVEASGTNNINYAASGNVGIGENNPTYKLSVNGNVGAREYKATLLGWSDYVFADDYRLMPLAEVEKFIMDNRHLPDIPSEKEVLDEGILLGEMNALLLAKIEELTLHVIKLNKEIDKLKAKK